MPVLPPWAPSVCVSLCVRKCVCVPSLLLTFACRCVKNIKQNSSWSFSRSLSAFSHIHAPATACIRFLILMQSAALTSIWATNSQTTFNEETRTSHCPLCVIGSVGRRTGWFHLVLCSFKGTNHPNISTSCHSKLTWTYFYYSYSACSSCLKSGYLTPEVTIGKTNVECLIQKDRNNNFKMNTNFYQIIQKVHVKSLWSQYQWSVNLLKKRKIRLYMNYLDFWSLFWKQL